MSFLDDSSIPLPDTSPGPSVDVDLAKVKPMYDRIVVRRVEAISKTKGGIIIPETAKEKPIEGVVIAVGQGRYIAGSPELRPLVLKPGDLVLFPREAGNEVLLNDIEHLIMREDEVLSVVVRVKRDPHIELMSKLARLTDKEAEAALEALQPILDGVPTRKTNHLSPG